MLAWTNTAENGECRLIVAKLNLCQLELCPSIPILYIWSIPTRVNGEPIEEVCSFEYLGSILGSTCSVDREGKSELQKAGTVYQSGDTKYLKVV